MRPFIAIAMTVIIVASCLRSTAVTILPGLSFTPATNAPLAGVLHLTTDVNSMVSILVSNGTNLWQRDFYDFGTNHSETLLGFYPRQTNLMLVTAYDKYRNACTAPQLLTFVTPPLPSDFATIVVLTNQPTLMEPGYTLFIVQIRDDNNFYITILDNSGNVVWYCRTPGSYDVDVRQLADGDLFLPQQSPSNNFVEINMLGQTVHTWTAPAGFPVNIHDGVPTDHGTILYLSDTNFPVSNFPSSDTISNASLINTQIDDVRVVEISATNSTLLNLWSPLGDGFLDATRVTYLTYSAPDSYGVDNEHANAVIEDTNDNSIMLSVRNQNAVIKFSRSGQLKWILGPPANWSDNLAGASLLPFLLTPEGTPFEWNYGEHSLMITPQDTLLTFDNGDFRASPFDPPVADANNYSRGVEFNINATNMEVSQVWDSTAAGGDRLFCAIYGKNQWLPQTRDILVTYGDVSYINGVHPSAYSSGATMARIIEYTHDPIPKVVSDLSLFDYNNASPAYLGYAVYRALRIPDLYTHPADPVTDLVLSGEGLTGARLQFSADPAHTYDVQASTDLINWTTIGTAVQDGDTGQFEFDDLSVSEFAARFYRVITQ